MFVPTQIPQPPAVVIQAPADRLSPKNCAPMVVTVRVRASASAAPDRGRPGCDVEPLDLIWG